MGTLYTGQLVESCPVFTFLPFTLHTANADLLTLISSSAVMFLPPPLRQSALSGTVFFWFPIHFSFCLCFFEVALVYERVEAVVAENGRHKWFDVEWDHHRMGDVSGLSPHLRAQDSWEGVTQNPVRLASRNKRRWMDRWMGCPTRFFFSICLEYRSFLMFFY